jgi:heavy metal sensor kinase
VFWRTLRGTRGRLIGLQVLILMAAAVIADVSIYQLVGVPLQSALDSSLYDQLHAIEGGLTLTNGTIHFTDPNLPGQGADGSAIEAVVTDPAGSPLLTSPKQSLRDADVASVAKRAVTDGAATADLTDTGRVRRRVYAESLTLGDAPNQVQAAVIVSRPGADVEDAIRRLVLVLGVGSLLLIFVGAALAYSVTSRALRPVGEITALARTISEQDLHRRVTMRAPDDELGELVRTFNMMLERLEATFGSLHRFTADASHELRAPLSVMRSQVEVALNRRREPADYERVLKSVLDQVQHLTRISDQLLLIARADAGELKPEMEEIDVVDFIHELALPWQAAAESRRLEFAVDVPDAGELDADPALTRRAIDNLLDNAFRYAPELSTVRLAVRKEDSDWVFDVSDEGPGVPAEQRERIFERFARADSARTRSIGGAGLGLALSSAIATAQGGSLELMDRPAPGATFRLRLRPKAPGGL